jgi:hypothetical protein
MKMREIYEYVTVNTEWFANRLDKGCRLYYDFDKGAYVYHYESEEHTVNNKYTSVEKETTDYTISLDSVDLNIRAGALVPGPNLGILEGTKCEGCTGNCKCSETYNTNEEPKTQDDPKEVL